MLLLAFVGAALTTWAVTPAVIRLAERLGLLDLPGGRKVHARAVPRLGGVAVLLGLAVGATAYGAAFGLDTLGASLARRELVAFLAPCLMVFGIGLVDDVRGLGPGPRVLAEAVAAGFLVQAGYVIDLVATPWGVPLDLGAFAAPVTILWVVGVTNAHNLVDGLDGLLGSVGLAALLGCAAVAALGERAASATIALALAGALLGFLRWNWHPARIFLGDCGSLTIGFALSALSLKVARNPSGTLAFHVPLLLCGLPLLETVLTLARRHASGAPYFEGDRSHIHHVLLQRGLPVPRVSLLLGFVAAALAATAAASRSWREQEAFAAVFAFAGLALLGLRALGYVELRGLLRQALRGFPRGPKGGPGSLEAALARCAAALDAARDQAGVEAALGDLLVAARARSLRTWTQDGCLASTRTTGPAAEPTEAALLVRVRPTSPGPLGACELEWSPPPERPLEYVLVLDHLADPLQRAASRLLVAASDGPATPADVREVAARAPAQGTPAQTS